MSNGDDPLNQEVSVEGKLTDNSLTVLEMESAPQNPKRDARLRGHDGWWWLTSV
jgi:hypothetical protein